MGSALSASYKNCCIAAEQLGNVYPVDSCNLSSASGLLALEAAEMAEKGMSGKEIAENIRALTSKTYGSFVVDRLDYLRAGGRCSTIAMLGANLLSLKPSIIVNNKDGSMTVGKSIEVSSKRFCHSILMISSRNLIILISKEFL